MIHRNILHTIKQDKQNASFIYPYYRRYSIAEIPSTILSLFNIDSKRPALDEDIHARWKNKFKKILFFFIDGLGYDHFLETERTLPFFFSLGEKGEVYPLTSVFPSTTPAALTTLHTGLTPQEHGLPEWTVYFEELDRIIETIPFRPHLTPHRSALLDMGGRPDMLYRGTTLYRQLEEHNIKPYVFIYHEYIDGPYSNTTQKGAIKVPFKDAKELMQKLVKTLSEEEGRAYFFIYWNHVDVIEHMFGPRSREHYEALSNIVTLLGESLATLDKKVAEDTLFLLSSDHGQASIANEEIIYLNEFIDLETSYLKSSSATVIRPTGSPHDVFLYVYAHKIDTVLAILRAELEGKAEVITTQNALYRGLFGYNEPSQRFIKRIGDILILPYEGYHVWYRHLPDAHFGQRGIHGGLSQQEMIVPFAISPLDKVIN
ncbi:MAG TPA: nucleotide pyrophosphatase/phosphodiesterase family protein [Candidatus Paceibacterota bacterium]|nr:nucleotide pyrophosphatase/phosphodiesterase family protein [Candidatus Paceibacterota bacterium]